MNIESIDAVVQGAAEAQKLTNINVTQFEQQTQPSTFLTWLNQQMGEVNNQINSAEAQVQQFSIGQIDNLHQVMMSLEKAKTSFELVLQVRNKMLEGYQEIMRMQV